VDTTDDHRRVLLWPILRWRKAPEGRELDLPWPVFRYSSVPGEERRHLWPLWGMTRTGAEERHFFLWPLFRHTRRLSESDEKTRVWAVPFFWRFLAVEGGEVKEDYRRAWPLASGWRVGERERARALDPWPWKNTPGVERNWAPFWTFAASLRDGEDYRVNFLWGLVRSRKTADQRRDFSLFPLWEYHRRGAQEEARREFTILKGLFGTRQQEKGTEVRFLYLFRFRSQSKPALGGGAGEADPRQGV